MEVSRNQGSSIVALHCVFMNFFENKSRAPLSGVTKSPDIYVQKNHGKQLAKYQNRPALIDVHDRF